VLINPVIVSIQKQCFNRKDTYWLTKNEVSSSSYGSSSTVFCTIVVQEQDLDLDSIHTTWIQNRWLLPNFNVQDRWSLLGINPPAAASTSKDRLPVAAACLALRLAWTMKSFGFPSKSLSPSCSIGMAEVVLPPFALPNAAPLLPIPLVSGRSGMAGKSLSCTLSAAFIIIRINKSHYMAK
jgi:hypothetical protein